MEAKKSRNIKLILSYDGTNYHGFQRQENAVSVQNVLEERLSRLFGHMITMAASGRTDAGVHALGQVVSFQTTGSIPTERIVQAANSILPSDIAVLSAEEVEPDFHARFSARGKTYVYRICQGAVRNPFQRCYAWQIRERLATAPMEEALQIIIGTHDFSAFCAAGASAKDHVRTIYCASCETVGNKIEFLFYGNGFLYHMVRNLVGTLVDVGKHRLTPRDFAAILTGRDRARAGITAPAAGLYLKEVEY